MVRKCLNSTAADNADLGSQGVCGDEHMVESVVNHNLTPMCT